MAEPNPHIAYPVLKTETKKEQVAALTRLYKLKVFWGVTETPFLEDDLKLLDERQEFLKEVVFYSLHNKCHYFLSDDHWRLKRKITYVNSLDQFISYISKYKT